MNRRSFILGVASCMVTTRVLAEQPFGLVLVYSETAVSKLTETERLLLLGRLRTKPSHVLSRMPGHEALDHYLVVRVQMPRGVRESFGSYHGWFHLSESLGEVKTLVLGNEAYRSMGVRLIGCDDSVYCQA